MTELCLFCTGVTVRTAEVGTMTELCLFCTGVTVRTAEVGTMTELCLFCTRSHSQNCRSRHDDSMMSVLYEESRSELQR